MTIAVKIEDAVEVQRAANQEKVAAERAFQSIQTPDKADTLGWAEYELSEAAYKLDMQRKQLALLQAQEVVKRLRTKAQDEANTTWSPKLKAAVKAHAEKLAEAQDSAREMIALQQQARAAGATCDLLPGAHGADSPLPLAWRPLLNGKLDSWLDYLTKEGWLT